jgi:hypothetical protein
MEWQLQTLALAPFGGPGGLLNQLLTEESQHLPCGEFYKRRSSRTLVESSPLLKFGPAKCEFST